MAFDWASFIGANAGEIFQKAVGSFKADPTVALQLQEKLQEAQLELQGKLVDQITAQIDVDKTEAINANVFVSGWRPAIGWICGAALAVNFILSPIGTWIAALAKHPVAFPTLDWGPLFELLLGMLGMGAMRTVEKINSAPGSDKLQ